MEIEQKIVDHINGIMDNVDQYIVMNGLVNEDKDIFSKTITSFIALSLARCLASCEENDREKLLNAIIKDAIKISNKLLIEDLNAQKH